MLSCPRLVLVPERVIARVGFEAFELIDRLPLSAPAEAGAKRTLNVAACPGLRVTGGLIPLKLKAVPSATICETVSAVPPLLLMVSESTLLLVLGMAPNCSFAELAASCARAGELEVLFVLKLHPVQIRIGMASSRRSRAGVRRACMQRL